MEREELQSRVRIVSSKLRAAKRRYNIAKKELEDDIAAARAKNDWREVHRLPRLLAGTGRGPKGRFLAHQPAYNCSIPELIVGLSQPGSSGGLNAVQIDLESEANRVLESYGSSGPSSTPAYFRKFHSRFLDVFRHARRNRAFPPWSLPAEIFILLLWPRFRSMVPDYSKQVQELIDKGWAAPFSRTSSSRSFPGLGYRAQIEDTPYAKGRVKKIFEHCNVTERPPITANLSRAFAISKKNLVKGFKGVRIIHSMDVFWGMAFKVLFHWNGALRPVANFSGAFSHRRRQISISYCNVILERLHNTSLSFAMVSHDTVNAFGPLNRHQHSEGLALILTPGSAHFMT